MSWKSERFSTGPYYCNGYGQVPLTDPMRILHFSLPMARSPSCSEGLQGTTWTLWLSSNGFNSEGRSSLGFFLSSTATSDVQP